MFLPLRLICLKINLKKIILFGIVILFGFVLFSLATKNCGIEYMIILNEIKSFENSLDPEHCEYTVEKIDIFNEKCESQIEILDCG